MDRFVLFAVQGTAVPAPQFKSINSSVASLLYGPALTPWIATGKTIALTMWTFVGKVMSLLFTMLSRFVITFLPRSRRLLISWLLSPSAVIMVPKKVKSVTGSYRAAFPVVPRVLHMYLKPPKIHLIIMLVDLYIFLSPF